MTQTKTKTKSIVLCALFAALITVGAYIRIPTPIISITLQTLFVFLSGILLGKKNGAISSFIYLFLGIIGMPVFTKGGGFWYVFEPSFGYIIGFVVSAYFIGMITEKNPKFFNMLFASIIGTAIIYLFGVVYFYMISTFYLNVSTDISKLILLPLPGDILSAVFAAFVGSKLRRYI